MATGVREGKHCGHVWLFFVPKSRLFRHVLLRTSNVHVKKNVTEVSVLNISFIGLH